jgi:hypothetical protein
LNACLEADYSWDGRDLPEKNRYRQGPGHFDFIFVETVGDVRG